MSELREPIAHLLSALKDLVRWFQSGKIPAVVIGGVAVSILGRPRVTRDIDAVIFIGEDGWQEFSQSGEKFGFKPRRPDFLDFAKKSRVLLLYHEASQIFVDLSFGGLPFEKKVIENALSVNIGDVSIPLPRPEDLVIMKTVAHRDSDLKDIEAILEVHPRLNFAYIRKWAKEFSKVLECPEIIDDLDGLLQNRIKNKKMRKK